MWSLIRKDLGEFVTTLKDDAAVTIKSAMAHGEGGEEECDSSYDSSEGGDIKGRRQQRTASAALRALRADMKTYTEDIAESQSERLPAFLNSFDLGAWTKDIATLLKEDPVVAKIHTQLVPEHVTYDDFWTRYFFRAERVASGKADGGMPFPPDDEGEDEEDFGWGEDDQEDDSDNDDADGKGRGEDVTLPRSPSATAPDGSPPPPRDGPASPAGGALGAMLPASDSADEGHAAPPSEAAAAASLKEEAGPGGVKRLASASAMAEIARLTASLQASEAERALLAGEGGAGGSCDAAKGDDDDDGVDDGKVEDLTRQRDAAAAEADNLREKLHQLEAKYSEAHEARATAEGDLEQQRTRVEESLARVAAVEEEVRVHAAARGEAEERAAAATDALEGAGGVRGAGEKEDEEEGGGAVDGSVAAAEAAAEEAQSELSRLKKAFREERKEYEAMLLQSRQAANEAVEAALNSADADKEEACAELAAATMKKEAEQKDEELEALRAQLSKSAGAMEEASTLRADLEDLRLAADNERKVAERAASDARQEADVIKQLREEIRVLRAAANRPVASPAAGRRAASSATRRGTTLRSDAGAEDTDGWGEDEDDSCAASTNTNSSGVVVERPLSSTSPRFRDDGGTPRSHNSDANHGRVSSGGGGGGGGGGSSSSVVLGGGHGRREGGGGSAAEDEGDDGWEGWD